MGATEKLYNAIPAVRFNPAVVTRLTLNMVEEKLAGKFDLVDPTNPFVMLTEGSATLAAAACTDGEAVLRKMYESLAVTEDELYLHMSDRDYLHRFASPARAPFSLFLATDDIIRYAEPDPVHNYRKLVIPKHTELRALDFAFTFQYPIEIRIQPHGGIDVVWVPFEDSPVETLASNIVEKKYSQLVVDPSNPQRQEFLRLNFDLPQFEIQTQKAPLNLATTFRKTYIFKDQFYYARVYATQNGSTWKELRTTHTEQVFDPNVGTAVLRVVNNSLTVIIPQIYLTNGLVSGEIRVDIYTTKGSMDFDLSNLAPEAYGYKWLDHDNSTNKRYYAPLSNMTLALFSTGSAVGGNDRLSFDALRERVLSNATGSVKIPITNVQTTSYLQDRGYSVVTDVDNVTNRDFLATRLLPVPSTGPVVSSAGLSVETLAVTMEELATYDTVADNGSRLTILPSTLYTENNGVTEIVPKAVVDSITAMTVEDRAERLNRERFTFSPFHYVLDINNNRFETRPYYLDEPSITDRNFIASNNSIPISVSTRRYDIQKNENGYLLTLEVLGDEDWDALPDSQVFVQLAFKPRDEVDYAYLNGTLSGFLEGNRVYQFQIDTNYDIDPEGNIALTSFSMYSDEPRSHFCPLTGTFAVIFGASGLADPTYTHSVIDLDLNTTNLPANSYGITEESFSLKLGYDLTGLWTSSRSVPSSLDYLRHLVDVPATYQENVYERDGTGAKIWTIVDGKIEFVILHAKGDQIFDQLGDPVYKARVGDVVLDNDGNPVVENTRRMLRQTDLLTVDGLYYFVTESTAVSYMRSIASLITDWVATDIRDASEVLLEQSHLYFYPKVTYGYVNALVEENRQLRIRADQSLSVNLYVSGTVFRDTDLRVNLAVATRMAINDVLQRAVVTTDALIEAIDAKVGNDVIGIKVSGLGGTADFTAVTLLDDSARLSIGKRMIPYPDGTLGLEDAIDVNFLRHTE